MRIHHGIPAAPGIAIGRARVFLRTHVEVRRQNIQPGEVETELARFAAALEASKSELRGLHADAAARLTEAEAAIFGAHLLVLEDPALVDQVKERMPRELRSAEALVEDIMESFAATMDAMDSPYFRERAQDIRDVKYRLLRNLQGTSAHPGQPVCPVEPAAGQPGSSLREAGTPGVYATEPRIIVAEDLTPSDTVQISKSDVRGFVTGRGGKTSHVAILASGLGLPAVVGLGEAWSEIREGDLVIVDGGKGTIVIDPDEETLVRYQEACEQLAQTLERRAQLKRIPCVTSDGVRIKLKANIGSLDDVPQALQNGAEGVGLLRTEFLFLGRTEAPSEDEQFERYREIGAAFGGEQVIVRTLDVGGDKHIPFLAIPPEENPFLGLRAIRLCLARPEIFKTQLRAILRASAHANLAVMFPMIATLDEFRQAKRMVEEVKEELQGEGKPFSSAIPVGMMVEIPAAAAAADLFAPEVDFFSIGTNDLTQYTLAVDRTNTSVADLYQETHPAVLRFIRTVVDAGARFGKPVSVCGELAGSPDGAETLVSLGIRELSMSAGNLLVVKERLMKVPVSALRHEEPGQSLPG